MFEIYETPVFSNRKEKVTSFYKMFRKNESEATSKDTFSVSFT